MIIGTANEIAKTFCESNYYGVNVGDIACRLQFVIGEPVEGFYVYDTSRFEWMPISDRALRGKIAKYLSETGFNISVLDIDLILLCLQEEWGVHGNDAT